MPHTKTRALALGAAALLLSACAKPVPVRPVYAAAPGGLSSASGSAALVFGAGDPGFDAFGRRDASLSVRHSGPFINAGAWPAPYRPSIQDARRVRLPRDADQFLYVPRDPAPRHRIRRY